jgi:histidinol-phosphatase
MDALRTRVAVRAILPLFPFPPARTVRRVTRARTDTATDLSEALGLALALADEAAAVTLAWFGDRLPVELKADATPVTEVDRAAEAAIRAHLAAHAPDDAVLGEEHGEREGSSGRTWVIDPVDGTRLYAEGIPLWTTLIALVVDGHSVLGVADAPALGVRYRAIRGGGAWRDDHRLSASDVGALADAFVGHSPLEEWMRAGDERHLRDLAAGARSTRGLSDAWGHLLVAQGSMEAMVEHEPCFPWDWSATEVIVEEAGGRITTLEGSVPAPGSNLLVTNGLVHDEIVSTLAGGGGR